MGARPIVNDALWRCLCPSFATVRPAQCRFRMSQTATTLETRFSSPRRSLHNTSHTCNYNTGTLPEGSQYNRPARQRQEKPEFVLLPTPQLYALLRSDAAAGRHENVLDIIGILIKDRKERPNLRIYNALLHSFVSPRDGTAGKIRKVLEEMAEVGVDLDAATCHAVLEVCNEIQPHIIQSVTDGEIGPGGASRLPASQRNPQLYEGSMVFTF